MGRAYCGAHEIGLYWHDTEWYKYVFTHVHNEALYAATWDKLVDMARRRSMPSPRVVRPGNLAENYLPKHVLFPLPDDKRTKQKKQDAAAAAAAAAAKKADKKNAAR